ncbi:desulfoferrodoxin [Methanospirillum lacunae]|uniref:Desulfoferrodoxin n=1 Tax=Methanospirillum lacunae TaxID=668570 RepID=A0A2V2N681_9EURY|nr:desulfoferrodoxin [Methanospirillum lacunae]PWR74005.1 desulfoferrodoxin [Methanospirillum lacunae]
MTELYEVYKCEKCGNITVVFHPAAGNLVCCGADMVKQVEKTADQGKEKHVPVIEKTATGILVKCGEVPHPMEEKHYIEWIEVHGGAYYFIKRLSPGEKPEAEFPCETTDVVAREYCTVHGLWTSAK